MARTAQRTRTGRQWTGRVPLPRPITQAEYDEAISKEGGAEYLLLRFVLDLPKPGYLILREYREICKEPGRAAEVLRQYIAQPKPTPRLTKRTGFKKPVDPEQVDLLEVIAEVTGS